MIYVICTVAGKEAFQVRIYCFAIFVKLALILYILDSNFISITQRLQYCFRFSKIKIQSNWILFLGKFRFNRPSKGIVPRNNVLFYKSE